MNSRAAVTQFDIDVTEDDEGVTDAEADHAQTLALAVMALGVEIPWDRDLVLDRLEEAIRLVQGTAGRAGPRGYGSSMPDYEYSQIDMWWQQTQTAWEREHGDRERNRPTIGATTREVAEADEALDWIHRFVPLAHVRRALNSWLLAKATRRPWTKVTKQMGLNHRTTRARRDRAIALIVYGLTEEAVQQARAAAQEES